MTVRVLTIVLATAPIVFVALWLAFQHKPGWYRPEALGEAEMQQARGDAVRVADYVGDQMVLGKPFEVVLQDKELNKWLAVLPYSWPEAGEMLPPEISGLAVQFENGKVRLGAHYEKDGWQAILSVRLVMGISRDGGDITVALDGAYGGSLPVPRVVLDPALQQILESLDAQRHVANDAMAPLTAMLADVRSIEDVFKGLRIRNRFVWFNGDRPFKIKALDIGDGELRLQIQPL